MFSGIAEAVRNPQFVSAAFHGCSEFAVAGKHELRVRMEPQDRGNSFDEQVRILLGTPSGLKTARSDPVAQCRNGPSLRPG